MGFKGLNMVKVKNLHNTSGRVPNGYSSWKDYWQKKKGYWPKFCSVNDCLELATLGGHVKKVGASDNSWYIVPLCSKHNNDHDAEFFVPESMLVPVNE